MADLGGSFDASTVEPMGTMEPLPAGKYLAQITESEIKATKAGTGKYLKLTFEIVDGKYKGRKTWAQLNILNPNPTATEIARRELSAIAHAVGVMQFRDSAALHNIPLAITLKLVKREDNGEMKNEICGYEKRDVMLAPTMPTEAPASTDAAVPPLDNTPPWQK
jgi:hypothetical protein